MQTLYKRMSGTLVPVKEPDLNAFAQNKLISEYDYAENDVPQYAETWVDELFYVDPNRWYFKETTNTLYRIFLGSNVSFEKFFEMEAEEEGNIHFSIGFSPLQSNFCDELEWGVGI